MNPILIESSSMMDDLALQLANEKIIAVDTEFFRETTYYPQLALIQIATDSVVACIDPLAFDAKPALKNILCNKQITKIFHSCSQDIEVLFYYLDEIPSPIYDTQIANAFLTSHHQIGYAALVENELDIQLDKSQTRTNWLQRPLTEKQIQYAGDDVLYLYKLQKILEIKLQDVDRKPWLAEENEKLVVDENNFQVEINKLWRRVKGATKLSRDKLAIVQAIAVWREQVARLKDKTRRRILPDDTVIELASFPPDDANALTQIIPQRFNITNEERQELLKAILIAQQSPEETWPDNRFTVFNNVQKQLLKKLQGLVNDKADELSLSNAIICSRKDLEQLIVQIYNHSPSDKLNSENLISTQAITQGWRLHCIGQQLIDTINESAQAIQ